MRTGARGLCIAPGAGPVVNEDVVKVLELFRDRRGGNVSKREFQSVLEESSIVGRVIVVVVCLDRAEGVGGRQVAEDDRGNDAGEGGDGELAQLSTADVQVPPEETVATVPEVNGILDQDRREQRHQALPNGVPPQIE